MSPTFEEAERQVEEDLKRVKEMVGEDDWMPLPDLSTPEKERDFKESLKSDVLARWAEAKEISKRKSEDHD